jgi:hypothetical protein
MLKVEAVIEEKERQIAMLRASLEEVQRKCWEMELKATEREKD